MKIKFSFYYLFLHLCVISKINENVFLTTNFDCVNYYGAQIFKQISDVGSFAEGKQTLVTVSTLGNHVFLIKLPPTCSSDLL